MDDEAMWKEAVASLSAHEVRSVLEVRERLPAQSAIRTELSIDEFVGRYIYGWRRGYEVGAASATKYVKRDTWIATSAAVLAFFALHLDFAVSIGLGLVAAFFAMRAIVTSGTMRRTKSVAEINEKLSASILESLTRLAEDRRRIRELRA